jgi:hypothetical protein
MVIPLYVYTRESSLDQIPAHRNLIGRCKIALSPVSSHSSSLPPPLSQFAFIPAQMKFGGVQRSYRFSLLLLFKNCVILNLCNLNLRKPESVRDVKCVVLFRMGVFQMSDQIQAVSSETSFRSRMISFKAITPRKIMVEYETSEKHGAPIFDESVITQHHPIKASLLKDRLNVAIFPTQSNVPAVRAF